MYSCVLRLQGSLLRLMCTEEEVKHSLQRTGVGVSCWRMLGLR